MEGSFPARRRVEVNEIGEMLNSRHVGVGEEEEEEEQEEEQKLIARVVRPRPQEPGALPRLPTGQL